ncbi:MAG: M48 family metalloprotease [Bacteroidales bacterium]|nr:M48 family metalloprotease [Bacteroidales bacterium]
MSLNENNTETMSEIIPNKILESLGTSLFNSLWIGAIIIAVTFLFTIVVRDAARTKYLIASAGLSLLLAATITSFLISYNSINKDSNETGSSTGNNLSITIQNNGSEDTPGYRSAEKNNLLTLMYRNTRVFFIENSGVVVMTWLSGMLLFLSMTAGGLFYTSRIKKLATLSLPQEWEQRIDLVRKKVNLKKNIRVLQSATVSVPMVAGYFKPVILIPLSALAHIPAGQLEAIIAHEMAHIRRNDFFVNILQTIAESVLFFNPATWYLSSLMRIERENCCDDIALKAGYNAFDYARALLSVQNFSQEKYYGQVAIFNKKNNKLLERIKRITAMKSSKTNTLQRIIALVSITLILTGTGIMLSMSSCTTANAAGSGKIAENTPRESTKMPALHEVKEDILITQDTIRGHNSVIVNTDWTDPSDNENKRVKALFEFGEITELSIDGEMIPENEYNRYDELISQLHHEYREAMEEIEDLNIEEIEREVERAIKEVEYIDIEEIERDVERAMKEVENIDIEEIERDVERAMKEVEDIDFEEIERDVERAMKEVEDIDFEEIEREMEKAMKEIENIDMEKIEKEVERAMKELKEKLKDLEKKSSEKEPGNDELGREKERLEKKLVELQAMD